MAEKEYFINDRVSVPEWIKKMTPEERRSEIKRLEKEQAEYAKRILRK